MLRVDFFPSPLVISRYFSRPHLLAVFWSPNLPCQKVSLCTRLLLLLLRAGSSSVCEIAHARPSARLSCWLRGRAAS